MKARAKTRGAAQVVLLTARSGIGTEQPAMSAFGAKADIAGASYNVCF
jgi:hypothetical protein